MHRIALLVLLAAAVMAHTSVEYSIPEEWICMRVDMAQMLRNPNATSFDGCFSIDGYGQLDINVDFPKG